MKISVDVDCTPEEARRFMGLPDLSPVHEAYVARMRTAIEQGLTPEAMEAVVRSWGPMGEAGMTLWRQMMDQLGGAGR